MFWITSLFLKKAMFYRFGFQIFTLPYMGVISFNLRNSLSFEILEGEVF